MNRATVVYFSMVGICAAGLWAVLEIGADRRAPVDLNGEWVLEWKEEAGAVPAVHLAIEQSGVFLRLSFDSGIPEDYRLVQVPGDDSSVELHGPSGVMLVRNKSDGSLEVEWHSARFAGGRRG